LFLLETLSVLQDQAQPRDFVTVQRVIEAELGQRMAEIFSEFDEIPLGVASLAQVHRARLHSGQELAIKVQHEGLSTLVEADLQTLAVLTRAVAFLFADFQFQWILPEFRAAIFKELNFVNEAENSERCAQNFAHWRAIYVPKVAWDYTRKRVLAMEFIKGIKVNQVEEIEKLGFKPQEIAQIVAKVAAQQIFLHGFIHADLHSGNMFVRAIPSENQPKISIFGRILQLLGLSRANSGPQLVLLDHGLYRVLAEGFRVEYCHLWHAMITQNSTELQFYADKMGIGGYVKILPIIFTHRTMASAGKLGTGMSGEDRNKLKKDIEGLRIAEINEFMQSLPRDLLFVLRTSNLVRVLNYELGGTSATRFYIMACTAARGIHYNQEKNRDSLRSYTDYYTMKWRLDLVELYFRLRYYWALLTHTNAEDYSGLDDIIKKEKLGKNALKGLEKKGNLHSQPTPPQAVEIALPASSNQLQLQQQSQPRNFSPEATAAA
jgi:aarF domain-containing kinase